MRRYTIGILAQQGAVLNYLPVITSPSSGTITDVGATVSGTIDNGKLSTVWSIEYGTTIAYELPEVEGGTIEAPTNISKALTGLIPYTTYHWRIKAVNSKGTVYSSDQTFLSLMPSIISDGNTVSFIDYLDLTTITKDGSNRVARWNDKLLSGHDFIQATDANKPLYTADGVLFDGVNDFLKTAAFTYGQPELIYLVFKAVTWTASDVIFDGNTSNTMALTQETSSPSFAQYAQGGNIRNLNNGLPLDTFGIVRILFNGTSSKIQVNELAAIASGSSPGTASAGGITLGTIGNGTGPYGNICIKGAIFRKIADTAPNEKLIYDYLYNRFFFLVNPTMTEDMLYYITDESGNYIQNS